MKSHRVIKAALLVGIAIAVCGCKPHGEPNATPDSIAVFRTNSPRLPVREVSRDIAKLLYGQNLIHDQEVNRKMNEAVLRITRGGEPPDSVMPAFHDWLGEWATAHPAQVEAARLAADGYDVEAYRASIRTDSTRKAQVDSVRLLVRDRVRRRVEEARGRMREQG